MHTTEKLTPSGPSSPSAAPAAPRRLIALDVLRGIAILGTLLTNIWVFSSSATGASIAGSESSSTVSWWSGHVHTALGLVTDGKFIGLLTMMFGIGLEIQRQSALRRGATWPGRYPWRAMLLVAIGFLHYTFVVEFDVLMGYGLVALVVAVVMTWNRLVQYAVLAVGLAVHVGMRMLPVSTVPLEESGADLPPYDPAAVEMSMEPLTYWGGVVGRFEALFSGGSTIVSLLPMCLTFYLVGALLFRAGLFEERGARLRRWVMILSFGVGLPLDWCCRLFFSDLAGQLPRYVTSPMVSIGVLALGGAFYVRRSRTGPAGTALSWVGRMALTCYVGQNVLASILFFDWGLGLNGLIEGEWSTFWTLGIYLGLSAVLVAFCALWLRRFERGPLETVWHHTYTAICAVLDRRRVGRSGGTDTQAPDAPAVARS